MEKKVPEIRFKGFMDDWEQCKLEELGKIVTGSTPSTDNKDYYSENGIPWVTPTDISQNITFKTEKRLTSEGEKAGRVVPQDTVLVTCIASIGKNTMLGTKGSFNQQINGIIPDKTVNHPYFLLTESNLWSAEMKKTAAAATMQIVNKNEFSSIETYIPKIKEQTKIGEYFKAIDSSITLHQRKLSNLKKVKSTMLEKMFPKDGEKVPEIRFKGFTDDWEQCKLKDFGKATSGTSIESEFSKGGKYKVISIGSYSEASTYTDQGIRAIENDKTIKRLLNKNDLTMILNDKTSSGNIIGRVLLIDEDNKYVYNQRTERIEVNTEIFKPEFLYQLLNADNIRNKIVQSAQGNTQIYVNWSAIKELEYLVPRNIKEQGEIAEMIGRIDTSITLHQRKVEKLQMIKKSMLDKMFV